MLSLRTMAARGATRARTAATSALTTSTRAFSAEPIEREEMAFDALIIGGGPAGLSAAIRLKQLAIAADKEISICVVEKGSEIGAHILSGNVFEPRALDELYPDWKTMENGPPIDTPVVEDKFIFLPNKESSLTIPNMLLPPQLHNEGNYVISLNQLCRWLGEQAEEMGIEVYPGFAASDIVYDDNGAVKGITTRDVGIGLDGKEKSTFEPGMNLLGRQTIFAEGARGNNSEALMEKFDLRKDCQPQTYGLGIKEVWEVSEEQFKSGFVQHTIGWPLQQEAFSKNFGGSFLYHQKPNLVLVGFVVGLDYENPYLNPYKEFQQWKTHPEVKKHIEGGECIAYGARVLNEGGYHSIPKLTFPGGVLVGCGAGFLNNVSLSLLFSIISSTEINDLLLSNSLSLSISFIDLLSSFIFFPSSSQRSKSRAHTLQSNPEWSLLKQSFQSLLRTRNTQLKLMERSMLMKLLLSALSMRTK
jgi:electron-transferring-flavoprotein dehydrogenase